MGQGGEVGGSIVGGEGGAGKFGGGVLVGVYQNRFMVL